MNLLVEGALICIDGALSLGLNLAKSLLHLILMLPLNLLLVVVDGLPLDPLRFILVTHIVLSIQVNELHLSITLLSVLVLPRPQLSQLPLFCFALCLQDYRLLLPALLNKI